MIRELLQEQRRSLSRYFESLDCSQADVLLKLAADCRGTIIFSGVGKSGHIAQKISATFLSTGVRSFFLDPTHAVHGDLGFVSESDVFFALSKSGESQELLELVPFIQKRQAKTVAIVCNGNSHLAKRCDYCIVLPIERELCPFDMVPTTSTAVQLLFGDCLAVALMGVKKVSIDDFARNHPGGFIGRRISLKVSDLMLQGEAIPTCSSTDRLIDVLPTFSAKRCGCLVVLDDRQRLQGIFTDGDLRRSLESLSSSALDKGLSELMTRTPRYTHPDELAWDAMHEMQRDISHLITVLPVVKNEQVVGLLRMHDILQAGL